MKPNFDTYCTWYKNKFDIELYSKPSSIYEYVITKLQKDIANSAFWIELNANLSNYNDEYYLLNGYSLLRNDPIQIFTKTYLSLINKTYRKNILLNSNYPDAPSTGWITNENWFIQINDLLRTTITVRYLDGVKYIVDKIHELAVKHNYGFEVDFEAREEGYYAAHITIKGNFSIIDSDWNECQIICPIEIQVTTQLQDVIKDLLHKMYEEVRITENQEDDYKWQWNHKSLEFSSNYLGHILHYVEGMILEVRDKQKIKVNKDETGI